MNAGWEQQLGSFKRVSLVSGGNEITMWPNSGLELLFSFPGPVQREYSLDTHTSTIAARAQGIRALGGTWDLVIVDWIGKSDAERQLKVFELQLGDQLLAQPDVLHLHFQAGHFYDDSMLWIELYNPDSFQRERMNFQGFNNFATGVQRLALSFIEDKHYQQGAGLERFSSKVAPNYLCAGSMTLATYFAAKRLPLKFIMELLVRMPSYDKVHATLTQLPDGGDGALMQPSRLAHLFG